MENARKAYFCLHLDHELNHSEFYSPYMKKRNSSFGNPIFHHLFTSYQNSQVIISSTIIVLRVQE